MESLFGRLVFMRECKWFIFRFQDCAPGTLTLRNSRRREAVLVVVVVVVVLVRVVVVVLVVAVNA
jgi:hypothetical protein